MSIAMFQKVVRTIIYAPYQFRQDRVFLNKYLAIISDALTSHH